MKTTKAKASGHCLFLFSRHVAGLAQDKFASKYMTTLTKSLQTPKGKSRTHARSTHARRPTSAPQSKCMRNDRRLGTGGVAGVRDTDLLYLILSIYESGSDYPSLTSGLVQALKQKLASFTAVVALDQ